MTLPNSLRFLVAPRFWALCIGAVSLYLKAKNIFGDAEMILVATITAGFITVGTIDRVSDKVLEGTKIESGMSPAKAKLP